ncbi:hypothetical protein B9479_008394, partial [Cryptococcus floricola]
MTMWRGSSRSRNLFTGRVGGMPLPAPSSSATRASGDTQHAGRWDAAVTAPRGRVCHSRGCCEARAGASLNLISDTVNPILGTVNPIAAPVNPTSNPTSTAPDAITAPAATRWPPSPSPRHSTTPS